MCDLLQVPKGGSTLAAALSQADIGQAFDGRRLHSLEGMRFDALLG